MVPFLGPPFSSTIFEPSLANLCKYEPNCILCWLINTQCFLQSIVQFTPSLFFFKTYVCFLTELKKQFGVCHFETQNDSGSSQRKRRLYCSTMVWHHKKVYSLLALLNYIEISRSSTQLTIVEANAFDLTKYPAQSMFY